jgi:putative PEP-CTERM system histidine kinase
VSFAAYSFGVAAAAYGALAIPLVRTALSRRGANSRAHWAFTLAVIASAGWAAIGLGGLLGANEAWAVALPVADLARYGAWFMFALVLLRAPQSGGESDAARLLGWAAWAVMAAAAGVLAASWIGGPLLSAWLRNAPLVSLLLPVLGLVLVEHLTRSVPGDTRWHVKPLAVGLACVFLFDIFIHTHALLFGRFDADALLARGLVHALAVPLLYIATKRQMDWAGPLQFSRNVAFHTATLLLVGVYLLAVAAFGTYLRHFGGDWGRALAVAGLSASLVLLGMLVFSGSLRARVRVFIGKNFFRYRYDYRSEWLRFTAMLAVQDTPAELGGATVRGLAQMLQCRSGAMWSVDPVGGPMLQSATWNQPARAERVPMDSRMSAFLLEQEWLIDLDELRGHPERYADAGVPDWLVADANHWLVVPLIVGARLTGFVVLGRPNVAVPVNWEVRDLLKTAARQAAAVLALMQATDALLEAKKFDAFNRMSAFVVHDLKNIVAQLSLMMQNARRLKDNPEFQEDMLSTVENSLEKMRRLMMQLREGNTPVGVPSGVELPTLVRRIEAAARSRGRSLQLQLDESVVTRGHEQRLERVIGHLVDNALDATDPAGQVQVQVSRHGSQAQIVVRDDGKGMSEDFIRQRLFKPFQSTKQSGMGIGAFESAEYVKELGGEVAVQSAVGQGTTITVTLPLFHGRAASDLGLGATP